MRKNDKKSKILKLYKKQRFVKLLSVEFMLPFIALFLTITGVTGLILAFIFKLYGLGGVFAGSGLSVALVGLTFILLGGDDNSITKSLTNRIERNMTEVSKTSEFENQIYQKIEIVKENENTFQKTKKLINELREKLKSKQETLEEIDNIKSTLDDEKANLIKQKIKISEQIKEIKDCEKQYIMINKKIKKLNPNLDVEYNGIL